jgi:hypothetical protein
MQLHPFGPTETNTFLLDLNPKIAPLRPYNPNTEEQGMANTVAGLTTSRFTAVNTKNQPTTAASNDVNGNSRRGSSSANHTTDFHQHSKRQLLQPASHTILERRTFENNRDLAHEILMFQRPKAGNSLLELTKPRLVVSGTLGNTPSRRMSTLVDNWEKYCRELCKMWIRSNVTATILVQPIRTDLPTRTPRMGTTEERCLRN